MLYANQTHRGCADTAMGWTAELPRQPIGRIIDPRVVRSSDDGTTGIIHAIQGVF
jgi:hypothetical protein